MDAGEIIALIAGVVAILIALFKAPHEKKEMEARTENQDADTAAKYQEIANKAAERALKLESQIQEMRNEIANLDCELVKVREQNRAYQEENLDLRDWADRLVHQVKSLGGDPVKLRLKSEKPK